MCYCYGPLDQTFPDFDISSCKLWTFGTTVVQSWRSVLLGTFSIYLAVGPSVSLFFLLTNISNQWKMAAHRHNIDHDRLYKENAFTCKKYGQVETPDKLL